jgi:hypothetical protein
MATPNVVPRANGQGTLGTSSKKWLKMYTTTGFQVGANEAAGTIQLTNTNNGEIIWEGSAADAHHTFLQAANATANRTLTLPNLSGTLATTDVAGGGTGVAALTDGGILLGSGNGPITAMAVLANNTMIVGDGSGDPVAESGSTLRASIGCNPVTGSSSISTIGTISSTAVFSNTVVKMTGLPTSDPSVTGQLWNNSGVLTISA